MEPNEREKHVILSLRAPSSSNAADTTDLIAAMFPFVDAFSKLALRPETKTKLRKVREENDKDIKKEAERDKKEEVRSRVQAEPT